jgi:hypothetical protein
MAKRIDSPLTRELNRQGRRRDWLAEQLGVQPWTFSRIEARSQNAPDGWYERAALLLGVPVDTIRPQPELVAA